MKILVTGGLGYIGSALVFRLLIEKHEVIIYDNSSRELPPAFKERNVTLLKKDCNDYPSLLAACQGIDVVYALAAYKSVSESEQNPAKYSDNITGVINLMKAMKAQKVKKIIFFSSAAVYNRAICHKSKLMPIDPNMATSAPDNFYGWTKLVGEEIIKRVAQQSDIRYVILRCFNVAGDYGLAYREENSTNLFPAILDVLEGRRDKVLIRSTLYKNKKINSCRDYVSLTDVVESSITCLHSKFSNITRNICTGQVYDALDIIREFERQTKIEIPFEVSDEDSKEIPCICGMVADDIRTPGHTLKEIVSTTLLTTKYGTKNRAIFMGEISNVLAMLYANNNNTEEDDRTLTNIVDNLSTILTTYVKK